MVSRLYGLAILNGAQIQVNPLHLQHAGAIIPRMNWNDLRVFLAVSENGSIRGAAKSLGVDHSTVSRRINALQKNMGARLLEKVSTGYILTSDGEEVVKATLQITEKLASLDRRLFSRNAVLRGPLRVTMPSPLATHLLMPDITAFLTMYPQVDLELIISHDELNLAKRDADVAIRLTDTTPPTHLKSKRLLTYYKAAYVANQKVDKHKNISADVPIPHWLGWEDAEITPVWVKSSEFPNLQTKHNISDIAAQVAATKAGLGMSLLPCFMADSDTGLRREPSSTPVADRCIWILTHKELYAVERIHCFFEFMGDAIIAHKELLQGGLPQP